jgi:flavodoxin
MKKDIDILERPLSRREMLRRTAGGLAGGMLAGLAAPLFASGTLFAASGDTRTFLTVFYSRSGNTQVMAGFIEEAVGGDLVRIETVHPYPEEYRATTRQAREELDSGFKPPITTKIANLASYDVVFIGSPCWWATIAPPVITFLTENDLAGKTVVPFMTHKGSGLGRTQSHVESLCPNSKVLKGFAIWGDNVGSSKDDVRAWLRGVGMSS